MEKLIRKIRRKIVQLGECQPKRKGRPIAKPQDRDASSMCTQERKKDGKTLYYNLKNFSKKKIKNILNKKTKSKNRFKKRKICIYYKV